jgi:hypothetical protein
MTAPNVGGGFRFKHSGPQRLASHLLPPLLPGVLSGDMSTSSEGIVMRLWIAPLAALLVLQAGCNKSPEGGTPGSTASFKIKAPDMATTIKQDNKETVKLSIDRGSDFKKDVKLSVTAPDKVKAELSKDVIKAGDTTDFTVTVSPAKDAPLGDHKVKVTGTPDGGGTPTSVEFTVKVDKNP